MSLKDKLTGKFIVFDGPDGSGKSTQIRLLADHLRAQGLQVTLARDPGGTAIGDRIREILLGGDELAKMDVRCETFLFMASRAQLVGEVIEPALKTGHVVLCDRFISATCAYQGAAGYDVSRIIELGQYAVSNTWPSLTLILDVPSEEGMQRVGKRCNNVDAMESRPIDYHRNVREQFLQLRSPSAYPGCVEVIDATGSREQVFNALLEVLERVDL